MEIKINFPENNNHITNLAYIKALLIKNIIEDFDISYNEKEEIKNEVLEYLRKTWNRKDWELESHKKIGVSKNEKEN